ncbi:hypothetical protein LguiA_026275 [Lonicera macranthoides]
MESFIMLQSAIGKGMTRRDHSDVSNQVLENYRNSVLSDSYFCTKFVFTGRRLYVHRRKQPNINECERYYCQGGGYQCENTLGGFRCSKRKNKARMIFIGICTGVARKLLFIGSWWMYKEIKKRHKVKLKKKHFKRNGGLLLQQQLASGEDGTVEKTKLFSSEELEKATDHYNEGRILGQGPRYCIQRDVNRWKNCGN